MPVAPSPALLARSCRPCVGDATPPGCIARYRPAAITPFSVPRPGDRRRHADRHRAARRVDDGDDRRVAARLRPEAVRLHATTRAPRDRLRPQAPHQALQTMTPRAAWVATADDPLAPRATRRRWPPWPAGDRHPGHDPAANLGTGPADAARPPSGAADRHDAHPRDAHPRNADCPAEPATGPAKAPERRRPDHAAEDRPGPGTAGHRPCRDLVLRPRGAEGAASC